MRKFILIFVALLFTGGCASTLEKYSGCDRQDVGCYKTQEGKVTSLPVLDNSTDNAILHSNSLEYLCKVYRGIDGFSNYNKHFNMFSYENKSWLFEDMPATKIKIYKERLELLIQKKGNFSKKDMSLIVNNKIKVGMTERALKCSTASFYEMDPYESVSSYRTWRAFELSGVRGYRFHSEGGIITGWRKSDLY